jgi:hypothetical protein
MDEEEKMMSAQCVSRKRGWRREVVLVGVLWLLALPLRDYLRHSTVVGGNASTVQIALGQMVPSLLPSSPALPGLALGRMFL